MASGWKAALCPGRAESRSAHHLFSKSHRSCAGKSVQLDPAGVCVLGPSKGSSSHSFSISAPIEGENGTPFSLLGELHRDGEHSFYINHSFIRWVSPAARTEGLVCSGSPPGFAQRQHLGLSTRGF